MAENKMVFNNTIYRTFIVVNFTTFILITFLGIDYLLPREIKEEVVISTKRKIDYVPAGGGGVGRGSFHRGGEKPSEDTDYLVTRNFRFQFDRRQKFGLYGGDTVKIYAGMLSGQVYEAGLVENGFEREIKRGSTLSGNLIFIPILTFFVGLAGVLSRKRNLLTVEIGAVNLILLIIIFYLAK